MLYDTEKEIIKKEKRRRKKRRTTKKIVVGTHYNSKRRDRERKSRCPMKTCTVLKTKRPTFFAVSPLSLCYNIVVVHFK